MSSASVFIFATSSGAAVIMDRDGPGLPAALDAVSARLTTDTLRHLDARMGVAGTGPQGVAGGRARAQALIPGEQGVP
jgi:hypothetical protein